MTPSEAAKLLAVATSFDRRTTGKADAQAWAVVMPAISFEEAEGAVVEHYANSTAWLMPAHVIAIVKARRAAGPSTTWCGKCDERTRLLEDPETRRPLGRCPACHPLNRKASMS
jgi:hypothetical protein